MEHSNQERMREIEIFGIPALFSPNRISDDETYPGLHRYGRGGSGAVLRHLFRLSIQQYPGG